MNYQKDHQKCIITCDLSSSFEKKFIKQLINIYTFVNLRKFLHQNPVNVTPKCFFPKCQKIEYLVL